MPESSEQLIWDNTALAERLARQYWRGVGDRADFQQVAMMGLVLATQRYAPDVGPFRPFAVATISGELKKYLRNSGWTVRVPRRLQEQSLTVDRAIAELTQELGMSPTPHDVAAATGFSADEVLAAINAGDARFGAPMPKVDPHESDTHLHTDISNRLIVQQLLQQLTESEGRLVEMRYVEELTQRDIADELGISQSQAHRRLTKLHNRLSELLADSETDA